MNPRLHWLQPYPFDRLGKLLKGVTANAQRTPINLSIGEPKHATPTVITDALAANLNRLSAYPATAGTPALREAIAHWLVQRYQLKHLNVAQHVLPVNGSREALFAFAQVVINPAVSPAESAANPALAPIVISPNPFYQIYEGAALLAGAQAWYVAQRPDNDFACDWAAIPAAVWQRTQLVFVCSPGNPTGRVMGLEEWRQLFTLADQYDFVIAADECYSEIWQTAPPLGALQAAELLGRRDYRQVMAFTSLSKRSSVPGMRSGFVAGDAELIHAFHLYRTYHGSAMNPAVQAASVAAWHDERHVQENRRLYQEKFEAVTPILEQVLEVKRPQAGFYLWAHTGQDDAQWVRALYETENVLLLPGSYLARTQDGLNPGQGFVRLALVETVGQCVEGAQRIAHFARARASH